LALGEKPLIELPQMEFIPANNEETFETVAKFQYVNGENTSVEFLDPYSSYSNVDNYWATNPQSVLYTINP
jgi:pyruvate/2-oxoglutarate/acetoin dehydrogenase E1 component